MRELQRRRRLKQKLYSLPAVCILAGITIVIAHGTYNVVMREHQNALDAQGLSVEATTLAERQTELQDEIDRLKTPAGVDDEIKERYNVAAPGEQVAIVINPEAATTTPTTTPAWYTRVWNAIISAL